MPSTTYRFTLQTKSSVVSTNNGLTDKIKETLRAGFDYIFFSVHSLRCGEANMVISAGISKEQIKLLGNGKIPRKNVDLKELRNK